MRYPCRSTTRPRLSGDCALVVHATTAPTLFRTRFGFFFLRLLQRPYLPQHGFRCALSRLPRAIHCAPLRLMQSLACEPYSSANRLRQKPACVGTAWSRRRHRAQHEGLFVPPGRIAALDFVFSGGAERRSDPVAGKLDHRRFALRRNITSKISSDLDQVQACARNIGQQSGSLPARRFLENELVPLQVERITRHFERDVVVTAERQGPGGVENAFG